MPPLSDQIDHLAATAKAIRASAAAIAVSDHNSIPFTRAVLDTALGDLIRDIDSSELGLFTLVPAPDADVRKQPDNGTRRGEISRVEFPGATPLRKQPARRSDMFGPKEYEPEVYARAALKYLDRYQSIRPKPRARSQVVTIIEQIHETREIIKKLDETLQELTSSGGTVGSVPPTSAVAEERRITDLQNRLVELRSQKDALLQSNGPKLPSKPKVSSVHFQRVLSPSPEPENHEDAFWSTPAASARTLRFTDRLLEEDPDFAELSAISFDSPGPVPPKSVFARLAVAGSVPANKALESTLADDNVFGEPQVQKGKDEDDGEDLRDDSSLFEVELEPELDVEPSLPDAPDVETEGNPDEEETIILSKALLPAQPSLLEDTDDQPPINIPVAEVQSSPHSSSKVTRVRITPELENIVTRIWSTVGDVLLPGKGGEKPPRAKETLALVESIAIQSLSPISPTSSISSITSTTADPTPHQVNIAQLLHALLKAPNHAMPLSHLKEAIGSTRALYACVAKKLIRIDRGGGEQIVLFDA